MCIIATKRMGVNSINYGYLKNCFDNNSDGAGYAIAPTTSGVIYRKGFFKYEDFEKSLMKDLHGRDLSDISILCHFRIATHGSVNKANCHPFEVSSKVKNLKRVKGECGMVAAMNGIIHDIKISDKSISDTMEYIKSDLAWRRRLNNRFYEVDGFDKHILSTGAKWTILCKDGNLMNYGNFVSKDGWEWSNDSYSYSYKEYYMSKYSKYIWDDDDLIKYGSTTKKTATSTPYSYDIDDYRYDDEYDTTCVSADSKHGKSMIPFMGIIMTNDGNYEECDGTEDYYIDSNNAVYYWDGGEMFYLIYAKGDVVLYNDQMMTTTYTKELSRWADIY